MMNLTRVIRYPAILFIATLFYATPLSGQTYSTITTDAEIYSFLNWLTKTEPKYDEEIAGVPKQISAHIVKWDTCNFIRNDSAGDFDASVRFLYLFKQKNGTDTIFDTTEQSFLFLQYTSIKDSTWHKAFSRSNLLIHSKQIRANRYYYSIPLFSRNRDYVIVYKQYYCGSLCAYGGYYVYKKEAQGKWKYVTAVNTWMS